MFDAYISYEACKQNKSSNIGRELFLPGIKLTSKDLPKGLSGGGFGDMISHLPTDFVKMNV